MTLNFSPKTEKTLTLLAHFKSTLPRSLVLDIIEMYLLDHQDTITRAEQWAKSHSKRRI